MRGKMGRLFYKKNSRIEKGNQIICIFNYFVKINSTYMKKGSSPSKLMQSFFIQSKFNQFGQGLLLYAESHYCRLLLLKRGVTS